MIAILNTAKKGLCRTFNQQLDSIANELVKRLKQKRALSRENISKRRGREKVNCLAVHF
jgi:F0F1-type ATP synthase gamma subunit